MDIGAHQEPVSSLRPGYLLCVSRLLPYKNVDVVVQAMARRPDDQLVIAGDGPDRARLQALAGRNVMILGRVDEATLRWLYANSRALVTVAHEDYGLTPLEAAAFGRPSVVLRSGGFLDTVVEEVTGVFVDEPSSAGVSDALADLDSRRWEGTALVQHAEGFGETAFCARLRAIVEAEFIWE
jgi:glycosyltransferase involved in cell wall biosynthesis